jgi:hypothetical protein
MSRTHTDYAFSLSPFVLNSPPENWFATLRRLGGVAWVVPSHFFAFKSEYFARFSACSDTDTHPLVHTCPCSPGLYVRLPGSA